MIEFEAALRPALLVCVYCVFTMLSWIPIYVCVCLHVFVQDKRVFVLHLMGKVLAKNMGQVLVVIVGTAISWRWATNIAAKIK